MINKDYLIDTITEDQILELLQEFGAKQYGAIKENEIWFNTICHGGDSHKLCYYRNTKTFYCYTNCGKMSLFNLVMKVLDCNFSESILFVAKRLGINNRYGFNTKIPQINQEFNTFDKYISLRRNTKKNKTIKSLPIINGKILEYFETDVFYQGWIGEGISIETMKTFNIRWYESEKHIIIPHYDINGNLIGIRRRSLQEKDKNNKYMPEIIEGVQYNHSLNFNLYGLNIHLKSIQKIKKVVLVESEKSVMLAHDYYGDDAFVVATCGFNISNWQRDMILSLGVEEVMLGYDKDFEPSDFEEADENDIEYKKYLRYIKRLYSLAYKFTAYCRTYILWDFDGLLQKKDSPFDRGKETLEKIMKKKVEVSTEREGDFY